MRDARKFKVLPFYPPDYQTPTKLNEFYMTNFQNLLKQEEENTLDVVDSSELREIDYFSNQCFLCPKSQKLTKQGLRAWIKEMRFKMYYEKYFIGKVIKLQNFNFLIGQSRSDPNLYVRVVKYNRDFKKKPVFKGYFLVHLYTFKEPMREEEDEEHQKQQQQSNQQLLDNQNGQNQMIENIESSDNSDGSEYLIINSSTELDENLPQARCELNVKSCNAEESQQMEEEEEEEIEEMKKDNYKKKGQNQSSEKIQNNWTDLNPINKNSFENNLNNMNDDYNNNKNFKSNIGNLESNNNNKDDANDKNKTNYQFDYQLKIQELEQKLQQSEKERKKMKLDFENLSQIKRTIDELSKSNQQQSSQLAQLQAQIARIRQD